MGLIGSRRVLHESQGDGTNLDADLVTSRGSKVRPRLQEHPIVERTRTVLVPTLRSI